jgi:hypothetical protein
LWMDALIGMLVCKWLVVFVVLPPCSCSESDDSDL